MSTPATIVTLPEPAKLSLGRFVMWLLLCATANVFLAWISVRLQEANLSPLILFSLMLGLVTGFWWSSLLRHTGNGHLKSIFIAAVFLALELAVLQHVFAYLGYRSALIEQLDNNPKAAMARAMNPDFGPAGFLQYMRAESREKGRLVMWIVDAGLITLASLAALWIRTRGSYCNHCHQWYSVVKLRKLRNSAELAACFRAAGEQVETDRFTPRRVCLSACKGCHAPAWLDFSWVTSDGKVQSKEVWLTETQRSTLETELEAALAPATNAADETS